MEARLMKSILNAYLEVGLGEESCPKLACKNKNQ